LNLRKVIEKPRHYSNDCGKDSDKPEVEHLVYPQGNAT
jgi:hypothetical protein